LKKKNLRSQTLWTHFIHAPKVCLRGAKMCSGNPRKGSEGLKRAAKEKKEAMQQYFAQLRARIRTILLGALCKARYN
jgi:hypothetical protein